MLGRGAGQAEEGRPGGVEGVGPAPQAHNPLDQGMLLHAGPASQPVKKARPKSRLSSLFPKC